MSDTRAVKDALRERVEELAMYLFPNGKREGAHWCVGDVTGAPGKSFKICISGEKAGLWGDFADSGNHSRSLLDLWMQARNVDFRTALQEAAQWTGQSLNGSHGTAIRRAGQVTRREDQNKPFDWQQCVSALKPTDLVRLGNERWYSRELCSWLHEKKLVGLYDGCFVLPLHDKNGHVVAAHVQEKDGSWRYFPKGAKVRPLVIGELLHGDHVHPFESYWDAFSFMDKSGERTGVIITRGASNGALVPDLIPQGSTVYLWTQNDSPGEKWQQDICAQAKCLIKRVRIPAPHKDLNDWMRVGTTADDVLAAMLSAETVREADQSWTDALNAAVVTSSELSNLQLTPRRKLLGEWFCEGDLGFIFAFRGVGKTWLALAITQALSTGGKLGEWQAHRPARVLYVDSEMPPDLMRDRCEGLDAHNSNLQFLNHDILFERTGKVLNIANRETQDAITKRCINTGIKVLIIDNLSTCASGMKENEADSWEQVNPWLLDLRRRKIAVVIVHHAGRSGEMRGTSKREDAAFWIIALDDAKKHSDDKRGARFISRFTKPSRNTQEDISAFKWHVVTENSGEVTISCEKAQTLEVFRQLIEEGVTECSHIATEMKITPGAVSKLAKKAMDAGWLKKVKREYVLIEGANR